MIEEEEKKFAPKVENVAPAVRLNLRDITSLEQQDDIQNSDKIEEEEGEEEIKVAENGNEGYDDDMIDQIEVVHGNVLILFGCAAD